MFFGRLKWMDEDRVNAMVAILSNLVLLVLGGVIGVGGYHYARKRVSSGGSNRMGAKAVDVRERAVSGCERVYGKELTKANVKGDIMRVSGVVLIKTGKGLDDLPEKVRNAYWTFVEKLKYHGNILVAKGDRIQE